jgi:glutathione S-transferase
MGSAHYHQWCSFSESTLIRPVGLNLLLKNKDKSGEAIANEAEQKTRGCLEVVDQAISDQDFLLGPAFSAADIMMGFTLQLLAKLNVLDDQYPNALFYLERLTTRESLRRTMSA